MDGRGDWVTEVSEWRGFDKKCRVCEVVKLSEVGGCKQPPGVARDIYHFGPGEGIEIVKNRRRRGDAGETLDARKKQKVLSTL